MRIAIVSTDNPLHKNEYINNLAKQCKDYIFLIIELNFKHPKTRLYNHLKRYFVILGLKGVIYSIFLRLKQIILTLFSEIFRLENGYNLKQISKKNNISYKKIKDVNSDEFIDMLKENRIDYIFNSGNQIFKGRILEIFRNRILNRHSSLLPSYGGIYPIYHQLIK